MKALIASYPRTGSTALKAALAAVAGPEPVVLHEPFRTQWGRDARNFNRDLGSVVTTTHILKHHPGNVLSDRQNRLLYRRWLDAGGTIVHLHRGDRWAQAKSLVIARALNSFHERHRVTDVPVDRLTAEYRDLSAEFAHQAALLDEVPHLEVAYEDLFGGSTARLDVFEQLAALIDPAAPATLLEPACRRRVLELLSPARQVRAPDDQREVVRLIDQVPTFAGVLPLLTSAECECLRGLVDLAGASPASRFGYGVRGWELSDLTEPGCHRWLVDRITTTLRDGASIRIAPGAPPIALQAMRYDGDRRPDHDLGLFRCLVDARRPSLQFGIALSPPGDYEGGAVHLAGRGPQPDSRRLGALFFFASSIGARRTPVTGGRLTAVVGCMELAGDQILAAGQLFGSGRMFAPSSSDGTVVHVSNARSNSATDAVISADVQARKWAAASVMSSSKTEGSFDG